MAAVDAHTRVDDIEHVSDFLGEDSLSISPCIERQPRPQAALTKVSEQRSVLPEQSVEHAHM